MKTATLAKRIPMTSSSGWFRRSTACRTCGAGEAPRRLLPTTTATVGTTIRLDDRHQSQTSLDMLTGTARVGNNPARVRATERAPKEPAAASDRGCRCW